MYETYFAATDEPEALMPIKQKIARLLEERRVENIAVRVGKADKILLDMYESTDQPIDEHTLFDMASVTKVMATTTLALIALDKGIISLDDTVSKFFDCPDEKKHMTIKNLLTHTIGTGHKPLNFIGNTYDNIQDYILKIPLDIPIGENMLYSCPGFILLGKILEVVFGKRLDQAFEELVAGPLDLNFTQFQPGQQVNMVNANLTDDGKGIVNDYNCRFLGGICGNAGLFSNMEDITKYVNMILHHGQPLISRELFDMAVRNHTPGMDEARGLGFVYVDERYKQTGTLFPVGSVGHCGHTGQSIFVDIQTGLWVVILSDATICTTKRWGKKRYEDVMSMREELHNAIAALVVSVSEQ